MNNVNIALLSILGLIFAKNIFTFLWHLTYYQWSRLWILSLHHIFVLKSKSSYRNNWSYGNSIIKAVKQKCVRNILYENKMMVKFYFYFKAVYIFLVWLGKWLYRHICTPSIIEHYFHPPHTHTHLYLTI